MSNVKSINGHTTPMGQPVESVVAILEKALERAKSGELRSIALAGTLGNNDATTAYDYENGIFALLGALTYLSGRIQIALESAE